MSGARFALILSLVFFPASSLAATFSVTKTEDKNDGVCDPDCSLREAIDAANANPGADEVSVPAGTYLLTLGKLVVSDEVGVAGAGQAITIIDGNAADRIFDIQATSGVVEISGVAIRNGSAPCCADDPPAGGGIRNYADLILVDSTVGGNRAPSGDGGGIAGSNVTLIGSTVGGNSAGGGSGQGGGIWISSLGDLTVIDSTVSGNSAISNGGGISSPKSTFIRSTVSGNASFNGRGGGIWISSPSGDLTVTNSTLSGNVAVSGGGGISGSNSTLTNSTLIDNGVLIGGASGIEADHAMLTNTIVANGPSDKPNCSGAIDSLGYNLTDDDSCGFGAVGDLIVAHAVFGPLRDNGGPTKTHALLPDSPAVDAGSPDCPPPSTDQRGVARPQRAACDIGAFELEWEPILAEIDIRPGSDTNPIHPSARGNLPVAILGSETFDVLDLDVATLAFGLDAATPSHDLTKPGTFEDHLRDVNDDGMADLVSHYRIENTGIGDDDAEACMTGEILDDDPFGLDGVPFEACDAIGVVPRRGE